MVPGEEAEEHRDDARRRRSRATPRALALAAARCGGDAPPGRRGTARSAAAPSRSPASRRSVRDSAPPSAYPRAPRATATSTSRSAPAIPFDALGGGEGEHGERGRRRPRARTPRSGARRRAATANTAVAAGSRPTMTLACADVRCLSASELNSGKPITTPRPTIAKRGRSRRAGSGSRGPRAEDSRRARRRRARGPRPTNVASRSSTARRVSGSENENASTPSEAPQATRALRYRRSGR